LFQNTKGGTGPKRIIPILLCGENSRLPVVFKRNINYKILWSEYGLNKVDADNLGLEEVLDMLKTSAIIQEYIKEKNPK